MGKFDLPIPGLEDPKTKKKLAAGGEISEAAEKLKG